MSTTFRGEVRHEQRHSRDRQEASTPDDEPNAHEAAAAQEKYRLHAQHQISLEDEPVFAPTEDEAVLAVLRRNAEELQRVARAWQERHAAWAVTARELQAKTERHEIEYLRRLPQAKREEYLRRLPRAKQADYRRQFEGCVRRHGRNVVRGEGDWRCGMRRPRDFYETASWQVDALTEHLPELAGIVWEPCVGDGSLLVRLRQNRPDLDGVVTNDVDATKLATHHLDATRAENWARMLCYFARPDWIVTNPPFGAAFAILQHAVPIARQGVVIMARLSFMEPSRRGEGRGWRRIRATSGSRSNATASPRTARVTA